MFSAVSMATAHQKRVSALDVINGDTQLFLKKCSAAGRVPDVIHSSYRLVGTFFLHLSDVSIQAYMYNVYMCSSLGFSQLVHFKHLASIL